MERVRDLIIRKILYLKKYEAASLPIEIHKKARKSKVGYCMIST